MPRPTRVDADTEAELSLRPARPDDAQVLARIAHRAYDRYVDRIGRPPAPMLTDCTETVRDDEVWIVELGGDPVGFVVLRTAPDHLLIDNVAVETGRLVEDGYRRVHLTKRLTD